MVRKIFTFYVNDVLLFKCPFPGLKGCLSGFHSSPAFLLVANRISVCLLALCNFSPNTSSSSSSSSQTTGDEYRSVWIAPVLLWIFDWQYFRARLNSASKHQLLLDYFVSRRISFHKGRQKWTSLDQRQSVNQLKEICVTAG